MEPEQNMMPQSLDLQPVREAAQKIRGEIGKIIVGQDRLIDLLLATLLARGHALIEGVPGVAKTMTAKLLARSIDSSFSRIQFTPDLMPADILGTSVFDQSKSTFEYKKGPIFANLVLVDEINRSPAKTQAALFEVMEERQVTFDGTTYKLPPPFFVVATQNPIEHEGTYRLPEAQLDRFLMKIDVPYPDLADETRLLSEYHKRGNQNDPAIVRAVVHGDELLHCQDLVTRIHVDQPVIEYITQIVSKTRNNASLYVGGSPRASMGILVAAKAIAGLDGRAFVTPEDVREVAHPVLGHRVILTPEAELEGLTTADVMGKAISQIDVPR